MAKILIVDDEQDIREILSMMIEGVSEGVCVHDIIYAESGNKAIAQLKSDKSISIVFCDYRMQDGNGGDVYTHIHNEGNKLPYIMISTDRPEDHEELSKFRDHHPMNSYLSKPFDIDCLSRTLAEL
ncbi:MAG: response regulator [Bacteriovoracaceae bacterium]|nr:response regulator [Bacteriovoracaceae bacterium]